MLLKFLIFSLSVLSLCITTVSAQQSASGRSGRVAIPVISAPATMQALSKVTVHGVHVGMPISEAIAVLEAQGYVVNERPQLYRGRNTASFHMSKGKVESNGEDREHFQVNVLMEQFHSPRFRYVFNPAWPVVGFNYKLQDRDNRGRIKDFAGYEWNGTPERVMADEAYALLCPASAAEGYACRQIDNGFALDAMQNGSPTRMSAMFSGAADGTYKVMVRDERQR